MDPPPIWEVERGDLPESQEVDESEDWKLLEDSKTSRPYSSIKVSFNALYISIALNVETVSDSLADVLHYSFDSTHSTSQGVSFSLSTTA